MSFDPVAGDNATFYRGTYCVNDRFVSGIGIASDVAVVVPAAPNEEIRAACSTS